MLARLRALRSEEDGFTLVELMITLLVLSLVMAGALTYFHGLLRNDRYQEALVNNQETVRLAMIEIARDLRNANPLYPLDTLVAYETRADLATGAEGAQTYVRWELVDRTLYRHELDDSFNVVSTRRVLEGVDNVDIAEPLFEFYDEEQNLISSLATALAADVANCAIRVDITIHAADDPVGSVFTESSSAEIRNRLPGGIGCNYTGTTTTSTTTTTTTAP